MDDCPLEQGAAEMTEAVLRPETVEIIGNAFISIAQEMKAIITRSAYSSTIQEASDFSIALFERDRLIGEANTLAIHIANCSARVKKMIEKFSYDGLEQGDVIITNDPYFGAASHPPDVSVLKIVRRENAIFIPIAFGHWSDVGGMSPGSISGQTTEVFQEGLLIPPVKMYRRGEYNEAVMDMILSNVRLPKLRAGDARAQVAACDIAEERIDELIARFGVDTLKTAIEQILNGTEQRTRARIKEIPDGVYKYEDYVDSTGITEEPLRIHVTATVKDSDIEFDFTGTSKQSPGSTNSPYGSSSGAVYVALKTMIDPYSPNNEGFYRPVKIILPEGTCINPTRPGAISGGSGVRVRIIDAVRGALADVVPIAVGCDYGCTNHIFIGGRHPKNGEPYVWYEYPGGGFPATANRDGTDSISDIMGGDSRDYPMERGEAEFPILYTRYEHRFDSGGPGKFRGGLGIRRDIKILDDERYQNTGVSVIWDRSKIPPYGVVGGFSGVAQRVAIVRADGRLEYVPVELGTKCTLMPIHKDDTLSMRTGGGGGYGDPLERDPDMVLLDLEEGRISEPVAVHIYGVVIDKDKRVVDAKATRSQRDKVRQSRLYCRVRWKKDEEFRGNRRIVRLHPKLLNRLGVSQKDVIELVGKAMAPLRVWAIEDREYAELEVGLDNTAMHMLRVNEGDAVWVRNPNWFIKDVIDREEKGL